MKKIFDKYLGHTFSYHQIFFLVIGIISLRIIADWTLLEYPIERGLFQDTVRFWLENVYYFLIVFLVFSVVCSILTKVSLLKTMNFGIRVYPLIVIPPLVDYFLIHRIDGYTYGSLHNFFTNILTCGLGAGEGSFGVSLLIILGMIVLFGYVYFKTRNFWKGILFALFVEVFLIVFSTPDLFFGEGMGDYFYNFFLPFYYFIPFLFFLMLSLFIFQKEKSFAILGNMRPLRSLIFVLAVFLGGVVQLLMKENVYPLQLFLGSLAMFLAWQVAIIVNDIYDVDIDRACNRLRPLVKGTLSVEEYKMAASILFFLSLSFAVLLGIRVLFLIASVLFFAYLYSVPPLRARNNIGGNIIIGISILIAFWVGIYSSGSGDILAKPIVFLSGLIFLLGMVLTLAKDIKDIEGDKQNGVVNLFTIYGREKGKRITAFLIFVSLMVPAIVYLDLTIFVFSLAAVIYYYKRESIFGIYISGVLVVFLVVFDMFFVP